MEKIDDNQLLEALTEFDSEFAKTIDTDKLFAFSKKQKSQLYLAIKKVQEYREDFPPDLADAIQELAKQAIVKESESESNIWPSFDLEDDDGNEPIILETGEIVEPTDELYPIAKQLSEITDCQLNDFADNLVTIAVGLGKKKLLELQKQKVKQLSKRLTAIEEGTGIKTTDTDGDKKWPSLTE